MPNLRDPAARLILPRLYAILDVDACRTRALEPLAVARAWLDAGVTIIQLRAKTLTLGPFSEIGRAVAELCRAYACRCIVNDRADVAAIVGAQGVHVGQDDLRPSEVRDIVGSWGRGCEAASVREEDLLVGLSTHTLEQVAAARAEPVDYLAIGPVFATPTKASDWRPLGPAGVRQAVVAGAGRPVVAIGGITLATAPDVIAAGAASVAILSDLLVEPSAARAAEYRRILA